MKDLGGLFHHILVPTDGSNASNQAAEMAIQLALAHHAKLTFVYVVDDTVVDKLTKSLGKNREIVTQDLERSGQQYLDHLVRMTRNTDLISHKALLRGIPSYEIDRLARNENIDLIVMGHVGRSGVRRLFLGPVAARVIELSPCPVLVI